MGHRPQEKTGEAKIISIPSLVIPISETVVDKKGIIVHAVDHEGYPTIIDPIELVGGHILNTAKKVRNALELNQAALFTARYGEETHMPVYYKNGAQRIAHISPLPYEKAVIQIWAIKEACKLKQQL
jgi:hypothetical protein